MKKSRLEIPGLRALPETELLDMNGGRGRARPAPSREPARVRPPEPEPPATGLWATLLRPFR